MGAGCLYRTFRKHGTGVTSARMDTITLQPVVLQHSMMTWTYLSWLGRRLPRITHLQQLLEVMSSAFLVSVHDLKTVYINW